MQVLLLDCLLNGGHPSPQYGLQAHDLQQLPLSCPKLQRLDLRGRIHGDSDGRELQPLLQLAGSLTSLSLGGSALSHGPAGSYVICDDALSIICQLSRLVSLTAEAAWHVTDVGLLSLCKLRQLRGLKLCQLTDDEELVSAALAPKTSRDGRREIQLFAKVRHAVTKRGAATTGSSSSN
jgi:hypothetical protein